MQEHAVYSVIAPEGAAAIVHRDAARAQDIADALKEARGITIDRRDVHLEEPIKTVGTRMVEVEVSTGVTATVKTMVVEQK
jgi:ribosomal protein L9